ncbi:MAG: 5'-methylthioadenosine/adenosylhomocysteine nucleosidase [Acetatifactor sp.]|nr:5'-methylthioadenosine/adenosylhomocysteine nucleosidase [Acetatifactor sp.]
MNKIGIIGAMELEVDALKKELRIDGALNSKVTQIAGMDFLEGDLNDVPVVIVRCGIGKVNAALCVQILCDHYHVTHVINTGVAGSLNAALDIGDILISKDALYHDMDVTPLGYEPGIIPQMDMSIFPADERLAELALTSCKKVNSDIHALTGRVVSGDQFIAKKDVKERLINLFHGDCAEMEGAAIAHACHLNRVPFVILRAISDKADDSAEMDYPTFEKAAAAHSAKLVEDLVTTI